MSLTPSWTEPPGAAIASVGVALPEHVVRNDEIAPRIGVTEQWIETRTGILERRFARPWERLDALAADAGYEALDRMGLSAEDVDLLIVATMTADEVTPNAAPLVAGRLGAVRAAAFDVGAACTGFLSGLALGCAAIESGRAEVVLLVGADLMSRLVDPQDRRTAPIFGDGAGAVVLTRAPPARGIGPIVLRADAEGGEWIRAAHEKRTLHMRGQETYRAAVDRLVEATLAAADSAGAEVADVDAFVYHQANARILAAVVKRLALDRDRVASCVARYGNTSAASLPIALYDACATGLLRGGELVVLAACGAGFTWGGGTVTWDPMATPVERERMVASTSAER
jgi:3-oxoacyl-[acyl-carrier-protein] synthase III